jgi:hypothetical protein
MTNTIAFALIIGFVVYVVVKGQLQAYIGVIGLGSSPIQGSTTGGGISNTLGTLATAAKVLGQ